MINSEHLPSEIFDWIETKAYSKLTDEQKQLVLKHLSEADYTQLFQAAESLKTSINFESMDDTNSKNLLLSHFNKHHKTAKLVSLPGKRLVIWQAAAAVLFLVSGWLGYQLVDFKTQTISEQVAMVDTVYVDREVKTPADVIHDTVILYKYLNRKSAENTVNTPAKETTKPSELPLNSGEMQVMSLEELNNTANKRRHNSMKDDSLLKKFGFVAM